MRAFCGTLEISKNTMVWLDIKEVRMGFHPLDIVILVALALLIFGPKTLQSLSHSAGRGVG